MQRGLLFGCAFLWMMLSVQAIDFSRVNVAWQYDINAKIKMAHRVVQEGEDISVFLKINSDSLAYWKIEFLVQDGYRSESHRTIQPTLDTLSVLGNFLILDIKLTGIDENLLVVKANKDEFYYYDIGLKIGSLSYPSVYPVDKVGLPIFDNYINRSGFMWKGSDTFHVMKFREAFPIADPPMADMKPLAPNAPMDTAFVFADSVTMEEDYFYVVRTDSNASSGVTMLRMPPYFPEYRRLGELIESMLYITSDTEKKSLLNAKSPKQSFDSFWMNNFNTKSRARNAIRRYYNKVEVGNRLFTDFKPGWKTDRGMIYMIFGLPNEVYRTGNFEEWYYDDGEKFEFTIISSFFAPRTYALRRSKDLEVSWYEHIAAIRRGINE